MSIAEIYLWALVAVGLVGAVLNVKRQRAGFLFWMVSHLGFAISYMTHQIYPVAFFFLTSFFLAIVGWRSWNKEAREELQMAAATIEVAE